MDNRKVDHRVDESNVSPNGQDRQGESGSRAIRPGEQIYRQLRDEIAAGHPRPGGQLSTRPELEARFDVSRVTMQRVLNRLIHEGFVETRGRAGTFVTQHPPMLSRFAMLFRYGPDDDKEWTRHAETLSNAANRLENRPARRFELFHHVEMHEDCESLRHVTQQVMGRRFAGVIATTYNTLEGSPLYQQNHTPLVHLLKKPLPPVDDHPQVAPDLWAWVEQALDQVKRNGRQRVAIINPPEAMDLFFADFVSACQERGLLTHRRWIQMIQPFQPEWAWNLASLIMHGPDDKRPDALLIGDDHLVDRALVGLADQGVVPGRDVDVIANFNAPEPRGIPRPGGVMRLGFDLEAMMQCALDLIERTRRGESVAAQTLIKPVFENQMS